MDHCFVLLFQLVFLLFNTVAIEAGVVRSRPEVRRRGSFRWRKTRCPAWSSYPARLSTSSKYRGDRCDLVRRRPLWPRPATASENQAALHAAAMLALDKYLIGAMIASSVSAGSTSTTATVYTACSSAVSPGASEPGVGVSSRRASRLQVDT
jgi:hypothetical protein